MWKTDAGKAYPFRHNHPNHFPPRPPPLSIPPYDLDRPTLDTCFEVEEEVDVPIVFMSPESNMPSPSVPYAEEQQPLQLDLPQKSQQIVPQPPMSSPSLPLHLTSLLQEILSIMNTVMEEKSRVENEDVVLSGMAELVAIMQEEAEMLVEVGDLVEELKGEIEVVRGVGEWEGWIFKGSESGSVISQSGAELENSNSEKRAMVDEKRAWHERQDSGVGLEDEDLLIGMADGGDVFVEEPKLQERKPNPAAPFRGEFAQLRNVKPQEIMPERNTRTKTKASTKRCKVWREAEEYKESASYSDDKNDEKERQREQESSSVSRFGFGY